MNISALGAILGILVQAIDIGCCIYNNRGDFCIIGKEIGVW